MVRRLLWNPAVRCRVQKSPPEAPSSPTIIQSRVLTLFLEDYARSQIATTSLVMSVRPSVQIKQYDSHWTDTRQNSYLGFLVKFVGSRSTRHFTCHDTHVYVICLNNGDGVFSVWGAD